MQRVFECDIYKSTESCFRYVNSQTLILRKGEDGWAPDKTEIIADPVIENYVSSRDRADMTGKICPDSLMGIEAVFIARPSRPFKLQFNPEIYQFIFCKNLAQSGTTEFAIGKQGAKGFEIKKWESMLFNANPQFIVINGKGWLGWKVANDLFRVKPVP
jgi:hypothetical protein